MTDGPVCAAPTAFPTYFAADARYHRRCTCPAGMRTYAVVTLTTDAGVRLHRPQSPISMSLSSPRADQGQLDVASALIHRLVNCFRKLRDYASGLLYHRRRCHA